MSEPRQSAVAYQAIVEDLVSGTLRQGSFITLRELAERTGCPLAAVRLAVMRLVSEGLFATLGRRGFQIATVDVRFVRDAYQLRLLLEREAVAHATLHGSPSFLDTLEQQHNAIVIRLDHECGPDLFEAALQIDWAMHEALIALLRNELISSVYRVTAVKIRMAAHERLAIQSDNVRRVMQEHLRIIAAMKTRNVDNAVAMLASHINMSLQIALNLE